MSVELKPCPNCGGQPKIHKTHKKFYVECDGDCWTQTEKHSCQEDAVKEWNTQIAVANEGRQMTNHKLTDDEIIHSLKVCLNDGDCSECLINPHKGNYGYCTSLAIKAALDLINRQKAEIEEQHQAIINALKRMGEIRSEAYKEFAEMLIKKCDAPHWCVWMSEIDDLVKEMTEADDESQNT